MFESQTVEDNLLLALNVDHRVTGTLFWRETAVPRRERIERDARDHPPDAMRATAWRGSLSHGQKQWLEIGMLLAQDPKLLLVDEPVAGMTDVETQQTAELLKEINQRHDRDGGRARHGLRARTRRQGDGACTKARCWPKAPSTRCRRTTAVIESIWDAERCWRSNNIDLYYGAAQALRGVSLSAEPGKVTCVLGRNGVGKTSLLRAMVGQYPIADGSITFDGADITGLQTLRTGAQRHRLRAAGP